MQTFSATSPAASGLVPVATRSAVGLRMATAVLPASTTCTAGTFASRQYLKANNHGKLDRKR